jgi:hypothetical protein
MSINQTININSINSTKKIVKIKANDEDLIFLAEETSVIRFISLDATLEIIRKFDRFIIEGKLIVDLVQEDAITSEEINTHLILPLRRVLEKQAKQENTKKLKEVIVVLDKEDDIDILESDSIDIQAICLEELLLSIDPFIKKEI